jgi:hypothetical protein
MRNILDWAGRAAWVEALDDAIAEQFDPVCERLGIDLGDLAGLVGDDAFQMLLYWATEDFLTLRFEPDDRNVIDDYLKRRGFKESVPAKRYLQAMRDSVMSLYEIVEVEPAGQLVVHDLIRQGEPQRVHEPAGAKIAVKWDRLAVRVLEVNGKFYFSAGVLPFSFAAADAALKGFAATLEESRKKYDEAAKAEGSTDPFPQDQIAEVILAEGARMFLGLWIIDALKSSPAPSPTTTDLDDELFEFAEARFPIEGAMIEIEDRLDAAPGLVRDEESVRRWSWRDSGTTAAGRQLSFEGFVDAVPVLGFVEIVDQEVVFVANSEARAERGRAMLADVLGTLVGKPSKAAPPLEDWATDVESLVARYRDDQLALERDLVTIEQSMDRYYRTCLDKPTAVLDGLTPRQAVESEAGLAKTADWLKFLENDLGHLSEQNQSPYDFTWMWQELGVAHLRR